MSVQKEQPDPLPFLNQTPLSSYQQLNHAFYMQVTHACLYHAQVESSDQATVLTLVRQMLSHPTNVQIS